MPHSDAGTHRSVRGSVEKCLDAIPVERIDKAAELRNLRLHAYEISIEQLDHSPRVEALCERSEVAQICEQDAHRLGHVLAGFDARYIGAVKTFQEFTRHEPSLGLDQTFLIRV